MTDGDALYHAILARPGDDTPRLIYADWLEENGHEEEAEYIRLDCKLEASTPDLPEYIELFERREELRLWLQTHSPKEIKKKSLGGLWIDLSDEWWQVTYRGFPRFVKWTCRVGDRPGAKGMRRLAAALEKVFEIIPTRWLAIDYIPYAELTELLKQPVIEQLECITINATDEQTGDEAARAIANCQRLRNLRVAVLFPMGEVGAEALGRSENLGRLEWLSLDPPNLSPQAIRNLGLGDWFRNIRSLWLNESLGSEAFQELCRRSSFPQLHTLDLSKNSFPASIWQEFARSKTFPELTQLVLNGNHLSEGRMEAILSTNALRLTVLDLNGCAIGDGGVRSLLKAPWLEGLRSLNLANNWLGSNAATAIAGCPNLQELKQLDLSGNSIGATGRMAIARSPYLRKLITLLLSNGTARNRTLPGHVYQFLAKLELPKLRHLSLSGLPMDASTIRLFTQEKFHNLTRLNLASCGLFDEAIRELLSSSGLQNLIELNLQENHLKIGVAALANRRFLPRLSRCVLTDNPIASDLRRSLGRRAGVVLS